MKNSARNKQQLLTELEEILSKKSRGLEFLEFATKYCVTDNGPMTFDKHKALEEIYREHHPHKCILKGPQIGVTHYGNSLALFIADQLERNCIYYGPDDGWISSHMATRITPLIRDSAYFQRRMKPSKADGLMQVNRNFVYYRGLFSAKGAISIPSHANIYDEVDFIPTEHMKLSRDRLAASKMAWELYYSKGMIAGAGIDEKYEMSDQRKWHVRCPKCRRHSILEEDFPANIRERKDRIAIVCVKCGKELDRQAGEWVAEHPDRDTWVAEHPDRPGKRGYRVSQLAIAQISLPTIWTEYNEVKDKPSELATFSSSRLAIVKENADQPVTDSIIKLCKKMGNFKMVREAAWSYLGLDMGDTCHLTFIDILTGGLHRLLYCETCHSDNIVSRVNALWDRFGVLCGVADAMPYKPDMRKIAFAHRGSFYLRYYTGKPGEISEDKEGETVDDQVPVIKVDRNDSLDKTVDLFTAVPPKIILPLDCPADFEKQVKQLTTEKVQNARGDTIRRYRMKANNHYGMSLNNGRLASIISKVKAQNFIGANAVFLDQRELI